MIQRNFTIKKNKNHFVEELRLIEKDFLDYHYHLYFVRLTFDEIDSKNHFQFWENLKFRIEIYFKSNSNNHFLLHFCDHLYCLLFLLILILKFVYLVVFDI
jgi:hypothetical protein